MHGLHHPLEHGVEELPRPFGVAVGQQLHRAFEVGEEDRDMFALAFERSLGGQNLFGQVLGGVGVRRRGTRHRGRSASRPPALETELRVCREVGPASGAA